MKIKLQEVRKSNCNKTDINKTNISETDNSETEALIPSNLTCLSGLRETIPCDMIDEMDAYRQSIRKKHQL